MPASLSEIVDRRIADVVRYRTGVESVVVLTRHALVGDDDQIGLALSAEADEDRGRAHDEDPAARVSQRRLRK
jgi:hypothetical protein